jgi:hypothetical protein
MIIISADGLVQGLLSPRRNEEHEENWEKIFVLFVSSWWILLPLLACWPKR